MADQQLMDYFKFDEADLRANRAGQFTEQQKANLLEDGKYSRIGNVVGGLFLLGIGAAGVFFSLPAGGSLKDLFSTSGLGFGVLWPLLFGALSVRLFYRAFTRFHIQLQRVEGPVSLTSRVFKTGDASRVYEMNIQGKDFTEIFQVTEGLSNIMHEGDVYAAYYTTGTERELLSIELMSKVR